MIEITTEQKTEVMEHAHKAYEHVGKMIECFEEACEASKMGERMGYRGDDWYIRKLGHRDWDTDDDEIGERMGYRRGVRGTGPYSRVGRRSGYIEPYMY